MDATLEDVTKKTKREPTAEERAAEEMVRRAREQGLSLTGPDGLLKQLTKAVLETALNQELTGHLGDEKHGSPDPDSGNIRNGTRAKTVLTESTGQVQVQVPRDRDGSFEPQIVKKQPSGAAVSAAQSITSSGPSGHGPRTRTARQRLTQPPGKAVSVNTDHHR
jgi:hypothetical protein